MGNNNHGQFVKSHKPWNKGLFGYKTVQCSDDKKKKISESQSGEKSHTWKGDKVGYIALHQWVYKTLGKPMECSRCGSTDEKFYDWHNISGLYKRLIEDWIRLCRKCHRKCHNPGGRPRKNT